MSRALSRRELIALLATGAGAGAATVLGGTAYSEATPPDPAPGPFGSTDVPWANLAPFPVPPPPPPPPDPAAVAARYAGAVPHEWGPAVTGTRSRIATPGPRVALTFDACGGPGGGGAVDVALLDLLERERIPATLFLNSRWIDANPALTARLAASPLAELGNHGTRHLPLSVTGRGAYGIAGTRSAAEVVDEVWGNHQRLHEITGAPPRWFRPGTAYCDEVAAAIVRDLGEQVVGFSVNGDAGASLPSAKVQREFSTAAAGSIVLAHMNRPKGGTAQGVAAALSVLRGRGVEFVTLGGAGGLA